MQCLRSDHPTALAVLGHQWPRGYSITGVLLSPVLPSEADLRLQIPKGKAAMPMITGSYGTESNPALVCSINTSVCICI